MLYLNTAPPFGGGAPPAVVPETGQIIHAAFGVDVSAYLPRQIFTPEERERAVANSETQCRVLVGPQSTPGFIPVLCLPETGECESQQRQLFIANGPDRASIIINMIEANERDGCATFLGPLVRERGNRHAGNVASLNCVVADFDNGSISDNLAQATALLGEPTLVVESGGHTEAGEVKVHAYWALPEPASPDLDMQTVEVAREALALQCSGDTTMAERAHMIRAVGSSNRKPGRPPGKCSIRSTSANVVTISDARAKLGNVETRKADKTEPKNGSSEFDTLTFEEMLETTIRPECQDGVSRHDFFNKVVGKGLVLIRVGKMTRSIALSLVKLWAATRLIGDEKWKDEVHVETEFKGIEARDRENHGPMLPVIRPNDRPTPRLKDWYTSRLDAKPPMQPWLVKGLIPLGKAGTFSAPGDTGKTMAVIELTHIIGNLPPYDPSAFNLNKPPSFFGHEIAARGTTVFITAEDDLDDVHRRLAKIDPNGYRQRETNRQIILPISSAGGVRAFLIAKKDGPELTNEWLEIKQQLLELPDLVLVAFDPLSCFLAGDTNDNALATAFMSEMNTFANTNKVTTLLTHHFRKGGHPANLAEAREWIRGASALVDLGRWALVMWEAPPDDAKNILAVLGEEERSQFNGIVYFGGLAKGNAEGQKELRKFVRHPDTGLLIDRTEDIRAATREAKADIDDAVYETLKAVKIANPEFRFGLGETSLFSRWGGHLKAAGVDVLKRELPLIAERLIGRGLLRETDQKSRGNVIYEPVANY